jgi:hypothetical protein
MHDELRYPLKKRATMVTAAATTTMTNPIENKTITVDDDDDNDDASIDEEQLEEYREMVEQLGHFPVSGEFGYFSFFVTRLLTNLFFHSFIRSLDSWLVF